MKKQIKILLLVSSLLIIIFTLFVGAYIFKKYSYSNVHVDINSYFNIESDEDVAIILDDEIRTEKATHIDKDIYLPLDFVTSCINDRFYYDLELDSLIYTIPGELLYFYNNSNTYYLDDKKITSESPYFIKKNDVSYVNIKIISEYTNITYESFDTPKRIQIYTKLNNLTRANAKKDTQIRISGGVKSEIVTSIEKGDVFDVIAKDTKWSKVHTTDGYIGYIRTNLMTKSYNYNIETDFKEEEFELISLDYDLSIGFDQALNQESNSLVGLRTSDTNINVICPTWIFVNDINGNTTNNISSEYIEYAHNNNIKVWPVINDFDAATFSNGINSANETYSFLSSNSARKNVISQIIEFYNTYKFDGINVDFENISEDAGSHYIQFIRELSIATHDLGIILSVDNYVPTYTKQYMRSEEAIMCDYIVLMGYDENGAHSESAGPNASIEFVENGIKDTLKEGVKADRLILAMPLYTNLWEIDNTTGEFSISAIDMEQAISIRDSKSFEYLEDVGYNYVEYTENNYTYKLWIEDEKSINNKEELIKKYELKGKAYWKLGLGISQIM